MISDNDAETALRHFFDEVAASPEERDLCAGLAESLRGAPARPASTPPRPRFALAAALVGAVAVVAAAVLALHLGHNGGSTAAGGASPPVVAVRHDVLLRTVTGRGPQTTALAPFPHATYTLLAWADPPTCLEAVELDDALGRPRGMAVLQPGVGVPGLPGIPQLPGHTAMPEVVQVELPGGDYRLRIEGSAECAWMVEEVLNSLPSSVPAPSPAPLPTAADATSTATEGRTAIAIAVPGLYRVAWLITAPSGGSCSGGTSLRTDAGDVEEILPPQGGKSGDVTRLEGALVMFLTAGTRTVVPPPGCAWQVSVSPAFGALGGGAQGFARAPAH